MKKLMLLLLMVPLAFAATGWEPIAAMAIFISGTLLAAVYIVGFGLGISELQMIAKEELFQLIALLIIIAALTGTNGILNGISTNAAFKSDASSMQDLGLDVVGTWNESLSTALGNLATMDKAISIEGSAGGQCSILGMGYSVSGCGGYSMLATPLSMAGGIAGFAVAEVSAMERLLEITKKYALSFILPLGIILRTFKMTRGAGGFLIALAVSMHIMLPAGAIFGEMLAVTFLDDSAASAGYEDDPGTVSMGTCNPLETESVSGFKSMTNSILEADGPGLPDASIGSGTNDGKAMNAYKKMRAKLKDYLFTMLIRATLGPVLALLLMMSGLRALSAIAGADVDVSAISRFV